MDNRLRANIPKLYFITFSRWFLLVMPILVPFYESNGLSTTEWTMIQAIFSFMIVLMEIPSGYFGDVLGRKTSIVVGVSFGMLGWSAYAFSSGFWEFLAAELLMGIGGSFISGSDSALMYDSLQESGDQKSYLKHEGRNQAISSFSEASAAILGAWAATISIRLPFYGQMALTLISVMIALSLVEPPGLKEKMALKTQKERWLGIWQAVRYAVLENKLLAQYLLYASIWSSATLAMAWFAQPYFKLAGVPLLWYGVLWTGLNLSVGIASWFAYRLRERFGMEVLLWIIPPLVLAGYIGSALLPTTLGLLCILLAYISRGIATPVYRDLINEETPSEIRATVLSIRSFGTRLVFGFVAPFMGITTDSYSLRIALLSTGLIYLIGGSATIYGVLKLRKQKFSQLNSESPSKPGEAG